MKGILLRSVYIALGTSPPATRTVPSLRRLAVRLEAFPGRRIEAPHARERRYARIVYVRRAVAADDQYVSVLGTVLRAECAGGMPAAGGRHVSGPREPAGRGVIEFCAGQATAASD